MIEEGNLVKAVEIATNSDPEVEKASTIFKELQDNIRPDKIGPSAFDSRVRRKLEEIVYLCPKHISAKMILLWGSDNRPKTLDDYHAYVTMQKHFKPIRDLHKRKMENFHEDNIDKLTETVRDNFEELEEYLNSSQKRVMAELEDCLPLIESVAQNKESREKTAEANLKRFRENLDEINEQFAEFFKELEQNSKKETENN